MEGSSTEIGRQRSEKRRMEQASSAPGRPTCTGEHRKERSTGPGRPTEVALLSGRRGRPAGRPLHGSVDQPVDRRTWLEFPFRIQIPFLIGIESNLGFHKFRDSVAINRG